MEKLEAFPISDLGIKLQLQGNLLYHEGPLLSHFVNEDNPNEHYFYKWTDCDDSCNRWLIFSVSIEKLHLFFEQKISLLQLIQQNPFVYFIDLDNDLNQKNLFFCQKQNIPIDYLPSENSCFKEIQYERYALSLKAQLKESLNESALLEHVLEELSTLKSNQKEQNNLLTNIWNKLEEQTKIQNTYNQIERVGENEVAVGRRAYSQIERIGENEVAVVGTYTYSVGENEVAVGRRAYSQIERIGENEFAVTHLVKNTELSSATLTDETFVVDAPSEKKENKENEEALRD